MMCSRVLCACPDVVVASDQPRLLSSCRVHTLPGPLSQPSVFCTTCALLLDLVCADLFFFRPTGT